jgi:hypothetical protein
MNCRGYGRKRLSSDSKYYSEIYVDKQSKTTRKHSKDGYVRVEV